MLTTQLHRVLRLRMSGGGVVNLNGVKPNERVVRCGWVKFK